MVKKVKKGQCLWVVDEKSVRFGHVRSIENKYGKTEICMRFGNVDVDKGSDFDYASIWADKSAFHYTREEAIDELIEHKLGDLGELQHELKILHFERIVGGKKAISLDKDDKDGED